MRQLFYSLSYFALCIMFLFSCSLIEPPEGKESSSQRNKVKDGVEKVYKDGKLYAELVLKNGKRHGVSKNYFKNGNLRKEISYKNGIKDGVAKSYYKDGGLYRETVYVAGKKNDVQKKYRPNGKLMAEIPYKNDVPGIGLKEFLVDGRPKTKFPHIVIKTENNLLRNNTYSVFISLSERYKKQEFYLGKLSEGKYLTGDELLRLMPIKGVVKLTYTVLPGQFIMEELNFICKSTTILGNPYITQKKYNLSIENLNF